MHSAFLPKFLLLGSLWCCFSLYGSAQETAEIVALSGKSLDNLVQGRLYSPNYFPIKGSPFLTKDWSLEDIRLQGHTYTELPVWYDIYLDELILLNQQGDKLYFVRLNREHIEYFNLENRRFINLAHSKFRELPLKPGFYEQALDDKIAYLIKRSLELQEEEKTLISYFTRNDQRYLIIDGLPRRVRNRKTLLQAAGQSHRSALAGFIKSEKIRFKVATEEEWLTVIRFLNTLQPDRP